MQLLSIQTKLPALRLTSFYQIKIRLLTQPKNTKTEKRELTQQEKEVNKNHASIRLKIENLFAHLKVMPILKDSIRNYKEGYQDLVMQTTASLYNFRNGFKIQNCTF